MEERLLAPSKALLPIEVTVEGMVMDVRLSTSWNPRFPIDVNNPVDGKTTERTELLAEDKMSSSPIVVHESGMVSTPLPSGEIGPPACWADACCARSASHIICSTK